jgi:hypothetical protein
MFLVPFLDNNRSLSIYIGQEFDLNGCPKMALKTFGKLKKYIALH